MNQIGETIELRVDSARGGLVTLDRDADSRHCGFPNQIEAFYLQQLLIEDLRYPHSKPGSRCRGDSISPCHPSLLFSPAALHPNKNPARASAVAGSVHFRVDSENYVAPPPELREIIGRIESMLNAATSFRRRACETDQGAKVALSFMIRRIYLIREIAQFTPGQT
jgi:hypothetical protein